MHSATSQPNSEVISTDTLSAVRSPSSNQICSGKGIAIATTNYAPILNVSDKSIASCIEWKGLSGSLSILSN